MNELIDDILKAKNDNGKDIFKEKENAEALEKKAMAKQNRNE